MPRQRKRSRICSNILGVSRLQLKQEEDNEMIRCIRGMKMDNDQLYDLLDGIQSGKVKFQVSRESDDEGSGSFVFTEENKEEYQNGEMEENE